VVGFAGTAGLRQRGGRAGRGNAIRDCIGNGLAHLGVDVGTTVTGIQTAFTMYTVVMASLMITGGKSARPRAGSVPLSIGCVIDGCGSLVTSISRNLATLLIGWSAHQPGGASAHTDDP
jgi:hypothetical protein